jgi:hypothetical protein
MKEGKKEVRNQWLHIRLNETEYKTISSHHGKTTCKERSDYARRVLLRKPVVINHRNQSADEILAEMIWLKAELQAIGDNVNQAVHKLHTLDTTPEVKRWLLVYENLRTSLLQKTEEIKVRMNEIYEQWSSK